MEVFKEESGSSPNLNDAEIETENTNVDSNQIEKTDYGTKPQKFIGVHFTKEVKRETVKNERKKDDENFLKELLKYGF